MSISKDYSSLVQNKGLFATTEGFLKKPHFCNEHTGSMLCWRINAMHTCHVCSSVFKAFPRGGKHSFILKYDLWILDFILLHLISYNLLNLNICYNIALYSIKVVYFKQSVFELYYTVFQFVHAVN
jgi:hypothetical protein